MKQATPVSISFVLRNAGLALLGIGCVMAGEYFFRHYVLFWMPTIGSLQVNDMVSLFLAYSVLLLGFGTLMKVNGRQEMAGVWQAVRECFLTWKCAPWILLLVLSVSVLPVIDRLLWGRVSLPMFVSTYRNPAVWALGLAPVMKVVSLILVNGLFVPVAEEYLWRGLIQVHLLRILPVPLAIGLTAVLFSFKHVLVDASPGRMLMLTAFGIICGIVARRRSWRNSAALHITINFVVTVMGLILGSA